MLDFDTIIAPTTTYGKSSLNVLRLSGKDSLKIAASLAKMSLEEFCSRIPPRYAKLTKIYFSNGEPLDSCIILYFKAPHSYTTEEVVEFQCHGGSFIAQSVVQECLRLGARLARPGEFTKRAFLGGRIDLSQAQAIAKLIETQSKSAHTMLMRHLSGDMQDFCESLRSSLIAILAHSEVFIDYADEELPSDLVDNLQGKLDGILSTLKSLLEQSLQKRNIFEGYKICIIGKPNVGKSSLLNALLHENRAIVSDIAGTTRDSIEENFTLCGQVLRLIDTAGIRESSDVVESYGIQRSLKKAKESDILIAIFDGSRELDKEDLEILEILKKYKNDKKILVLINKVDLQEKLSQEVLAEFSPLKLTLKGNLNREDSLLSSFKEKLGEILNTQDNAESLLLISEYQFNAVKNCIESLQNAKEPLGFLELELFSFHINSALSELSLITKPYEYSEMLDVMFGEFCLGK
ncbi:MAG: tRNA uridine-5-carboxymethylaminomethyl(34) synthesis GTPase MnmE [Helicobacteraceae bacterium]|nr:tRNA uridine-5-carboxymethylaminomethyl(34) synthesis GTPase MnmE [Helicobacteraceae bacterium]